MRIQRILEAYETEVKARNYSGLGSNRALGGYKNSAKNNRIGLGTRSVVIDDKTDPHMVRKYNHSVSSKGGEDGFGKFFEWITKNKIENIYLPRVYKIQKATNPDTGYIAYSYRMEKLTKITDLEDYEIISLLSKCIDIDGIFKKHILADYPTESIESADILKHVVDIEYYSLKYIDLVFTQPYTTNKFIIDQELVNALDILNRYVKENYEGNYMKAGADLHSGNFMARRTRHGLQLVISDPFW